jgi:hypothetical protein
MSTAITAKEFIDKWGDSGSHAGENERQGAQAFFLDLCDLLSVPKPGEQEGYVFEKQTLALGQERGYADVFWRNHFAWENKAPGKSLEGALRQLLGYSLALASPPLLVVSDRLTTRIHTQFNGHPSETHTIETKHLDQPEKQQLLRRVWLNPESFRPKQTNRDITERAAQSFAKLADSLRKRGPQDSPAREQHAERVAHFLTQTLFCFFAEDVGLLPSRMFELILNNRHFTAVQLTQTLQKLLETMREGGPFGSDYVPWFNGGLFKTVSVPELSILEITELRNAAQLNWSAIDVSIFGTLFERGLDPAKRSQLGAHYTDPATIERIIEPVIRRPLLQKWELEKQEISRRLAKNTKNSVKEAQQRLESFLISLTDFKVLDPACGSGNFLYLGLKALKDVEHQIITEAGNLGLQRPLDLCTSPANMLGIEINEYAAELARVTVWIGELQWRKDKGYPFKDNPILEPLECIEHRDALLTWQGQGDERKAAEADWPKVSVVIGNPPFLGGNKKRRELGDQYFDALNQVFKNRVAGSADLVCYWFEKGRKAIETQGLGAAGFVATQSIRHGANRQVLDSITSSTRIFQAWSDEPWVNDGAAVRVALVAFGWGDCCFLNEQRVQGITASLTSNELSDSTSAKALVENANRCFQGSQKIGAFDIDGALARQWLASPNPHGQSNARILKPYCNGLDITRRPRDMWIVDFGLRSELGEAMLFERPFQYAITMIKPDRIKNAREVRAKYWWRHGDGQPAMRAAIGNVARYIATPETAKHRVFVWLDKAVLPDKKLIVMAAADDTTFGVLCSRIHEVWALERASMHGVGNDPRYTPTTCFETFPFPAGLTPADTAHQRTQLIEGGALVPAGLAGSEFYPSNQPLAPVNTAVEAIKSIANSNSTSSTFAQACAIARAAQALNALRERWLNPPEWTQRVSEVIPLGMQTSPYPERILPRTDLSEQDAKALQQRTLTNLYNAKAKGEVQWLTAAHEQLDQAVAAAYGWTDYSSAMPDEEILKRLLALNLERVG